MLIVSPSPFVRAALLIMGVLVAVLPTACRPQKELHLSGKTMGTTYHVKVVTNLFTDGSALQQQIDQRLTTINKSMSTYDPESEISRFNAIQSTSQPFTPSADFFKVLTVAAELHRLTDGAWDGTLDPLVNLWGFGRNGSVSRMPDEDDIRQALAKVGFNRIHIDPSGLIRKNDGDVTLDLASIAKGYGVDALARLLGGEGYEHFLVEIGGEVYAHGLRKDGRPWRVGINRPDKAAAVNTVYKMVALKNQAMATSGDYRLFFQIGDQTYSHILDPRTGWPVATNVVSATVVAANCTVADGLATALMVMGPEKGIALVNRIDAVECLMVVRQPDGALTDHPSSGFLIR